MDRIRLSGQRTLLCLALAAVFAGSVILTGCEQGETTVAERRVDLVVIDAMSAFGALERPAVLFPHDRHTQALLNQDNDCRTCHLYDEKHNLSLKFQRLSDDDPETVMEGYHDGCIQCHQQMADSGLHSGPITCGPCHQLTPTVISSRQPMGFDKSLHYRHIEANGNDCSACHAEEVKGQEQSCRNCHDSQTAHTFGHVAHKACVTCHLKKETGPRNCAGCHDLDQQAAIEIVENPPRLKGNQPDFVLISAAASGPASGKMQTVPFSHIGHEEFTTTCRGCHHESMKRCGDCHTLVGNDRAEGVTLVRAMHSMSSSFSCIGCHEKQKLASECAGCHSLMEQGRLSEHACEICHIGPLPGNLENAAGRYKSLADFKPRPSDVSLSFADRDIPEHITIDILAKDYEPVVFPHRLVVRKLMQRIADSKAATHFHGHQDVVCQGCHHHSPIGKRPPLCESCHGDPFNKATLLMPGLYGAYHRQCLGCHEEMGITKTDGCEGCHALRKM